MDLYRHTPSFLLAEKICQTLSQKGFQSFLAGGCVRDFLLHRIPHDFDVATSATPDQVEELFEKTLPVGKNFGVVIVVDGEVQVEVATFRKDGPYEDGRRPISIEFSQAEEDAQRRDFTVNGLFYDLQKQEVIDYVDGLKDLEKKRIRAIGVPAQRFNEDHLRLLRALRFAAQIDFEIESRTWKDLTSCRHLIQTVSGERIQAEIAKMLMSVQVEKGLRLFFESGLLESLLQKPISTLKDPFLVFSRKEKSLEDHWFRFFFWLRQMDPLNLKLADFEHFCDQWKFSRDLKQKTLKAMKWTFENRPFLHHPLGELLAASYDPENMRGLIEYSEFYLQETERVEFERFLSRRLELGREKPAPWVTAKDLSKTVQGEALGRALRACYWEQLEGNAHQKEDLLKIWGS